MDREHVWSVCICMCVCLSEISSFRSVHYIRSDSNDILFNYHRLIVMSAHAFAYYLAYVKWCASFFSSPGAANLYVIHFFFLDITIGCMCLTVNLNVHTQPLFSVYFCGFSRSLSMGRMYARILIHYKYLRLLRNSYCLLSLYCLSSSLSLRSQQIVRVVGRSLFTCAWLYAYCMHTRQARTANDNSNIRDIKKEFETIHLIEKQ